MFKRIAIILSFFSCIVITSIVICKYFHTPKILLSIIIVASIYYQIDVNKKYNNKYNYEETVINLSKFIIFTGVLGCIVGKFIGLFLSGYD